MVVICATCGVKKPPLSPLSEENLQLLGAIVAPFVNMTDFRDQQLLICVNCKLLINGVRNFQVTARRSLRALKSLLNELDGLATFVKPILEAKPEPITIKTEREDDLPTTNQQNSSVLASNDLQKKSQSKETELKPELESKSELNYDSESTMSANETPDLISELDPLMAKSESVESPTSTSTKQSNKNAQEILDPMSHPDPLARSGSVGSAASTSAGQNKKKYIVPIVHSKPGASNLLCRVYTKKPEPKPTQIKKTIVIKNAVNPIQAAKIAQSDKNDLKVTSVKIVKPILVDLEQRVTTKWQIAENAAKVAPEVGNLDLLTQETIEANRAPLLIPEDCEDVRPKKKVYKYKLKEFSCPHCDKIVKGKPYLREHIERFHVNLKPTPCETCGKVFRNEKALKAHIKLSHEQKVKTIDDLNPELYCVECSIQCFTRGAFKRHLMSRKHFPKEQYTIECEICKKKFPTEKRLKLHNDVVHLKKKPYKCDTCGKTFPRAWPLNRHVLVVHDNQFMMPRKTHVCHVCGKSFTAPKSLEEHLLVHQGLRPFACELCPATFSYKAALFNHNRLKHLKMKWNYKKKTKQEGDEKRPKKRRKVEQDDQGGIEKDARLKKKRKADKEQGVVGKAEKVEKGGGIGKEGELKKGKKVEETRVDTETEEIDKLGIIDGDSLDIDSYFNNM